jgi:hypothetical protein
MADRKQFLGNIEPDPELKRILAATHDIPVTEEELRQQRISFAFGNAPHDSEQFITKESVTAASLRIRMFEH